MERINKFYLIIGLAMAAILLIGFVANADELGEATTIAFSASVEIPGQVLTAWRSPDDNVLASGRSPQSSVIKTGEES